MWASPESKVHLASPGDHVKSQFALRATLRSVVGDKFCCKKLPQNFPPSGDGLAVATYYKPTKLQNTKGICHWRWLGHSILHHAPDSLIRSVFTSSANFCFLRWNIYAILWINSLIIKSTNFFIFYIPLEGCKVYLTNVEGFGQLTRLCYIQYPYLNTQ